MVMSEIPEDLYYTKEHEWIKVDGDEVIIGITDHAQHALTDIVYIELPEVGQVMGEMDEFASNQNYDDLVAINEILEKLAEIDPRKAQLVKLRYFVGMTGEEVAETMDMSLTTVNRDWAFARAWLYKELHK